jgi:internalin A
MTALRSLDLSHSLRFNTPEPVTGDALLDEIFDESPGGAVPAVLAMLPALERLNLDHCEIADLEPLRGAVQLQALSLNGGKFADLTPLSGLTCLESLSMDTCYQARDLSPLRSVPLTGLSLRSTITGYPWRRSPTSGPSSPST